jgi:hypothetical protein
LNHISLFVRRGRVLTAFALWAAAWMAVPSSVEAQPPPTADQQLGFSRYLPEDVDGYVSLMQMGRVVQSVGESNAWKQFEKVPEIEMGLARLRELRDSPELPPPAKIGLEFLLSSAESEVTLAVRPDVSKNLLGVAKLGLLSFGSYAPPPFDPNSPEGLAFQKKQSELRQEWVKTIGTIQIPSIVVATRFREPAKYDLFVRSAIGSMRSKMFEEMQRGAPPEILAKLEAAFVETQVGKSTLWKFHLRAGDILPPEAIAGNLRNSPLGEAERTAAAAAVANLTLDVHLGFVGEYLTLVISSSDELIKGIVDRYEGRAQQSLAASAAFAPVRAEVTPNTLGIVYADSSASRKELRESLLPLVKSLSEPEFLTVMGAPKEITQIASRVRGELEKWVEAIPAKQFSVLQLEQGLRQFSQTEFDRAPVAAPTTPLATLGSVPADSIGFIAWREVSFDPLWEQAAMLLEQGSADAAERRKRYADDPRMLEIFGDMTAKFDNAIKPIKGKLIGSMKGEAAVVIGPFVQFEAMGEAAAEIPKLSVPSVALVIHSSAADRAIEGLAELFQAAVDFDARPGRPSDIPFSLETKEVDGLQVRILKFKGPEVRGAELHMVKLGDRFVLSSSLELTKQIRDAAGGSKPAIGSTPGYQSVEAQMPATAQQLFYVDGETLMKSIRKTATEGFAFVEANAGKFRMSDRDLQEFAVFRRVFDGGFKVLSTFRRAYGSQVIEGKTNVLREWIRIEDAATE